MGQLQAQLDVLAAAVKADSQTKLASCSNNRQRHALVDFVQNLRRHVQAGIRRRQLRMSIVSDPNERFERHDSNERGVNK